LKNNTDGKHVFNK